MTTFNAFWYGRPFHVFDWSCISSFVRRGHEYRLHVYEDMEVPHGVALVDANEILSRHHLFLITNKMSGEQDAGPFSDVFRYKLLVERGGWYVDVDTVCLRDNFPDQVRAWASENEGVEQKVIVNGAQMCMPKGDPLAAVLYARSVDIGHASEKREDWGPNLLTKVISEMGLPVNITGRTTNFYPIDWISAFVLMLPRYRDYVAARLSDAWFMAVYQSLFKYMGIDLTRIPPKGSYMRILYETYAPDLMCGDEYTTDEIEMAARAYLSANKDWAIGQVCRSLGKEILTYLQL